MNAIADGSRNPPEVASVRAISHSAFASRRRAAAVSLSSELGMNRSGAAERCRERTDGPRGKLAEFRPPLNSAHRLQPVCQGRPVGQASAQQQLRRIEVDQTGDPIIGWSAAWHGCGWREALREVAYGYRHEFGGDAEFHSYESG